MMLHSFNTQNTAAPSSPQRKATMKDLFNQYIVDMSSSEADPVQEKDAAVQMVPFDASAWEWAPTFEYSEDEAKAYFLQQLQALKVQYQRDVQDCMAAARDFFMQSAQTKREHERAKKNAQAPITTEEIVSDFASPNYYHHYFEQQQPKYQEQLQPAQAKRQRGMGKKNVQVPITNEPQPQYQECQAIIKRAYNLDRHLKTHDQQDAPGEPQASAEDRAYYKCQVCQMVVKRACELIRHVKAHDPALKFECPDCHRLYSRPDGLQRHRVRTCVFRTF